MACRSQPAHLRPHPEKGARMCGIVGYVGRRPGKPIILDGLRRLEYRGYDSAGIVLVEADGLESVRSVGNLDALFAAAGPNSSQAVVGLGHTRWATHGRPSHENAHPHDDCTGKVSIVVNGIVENYKELRTELCARGHEFKSETVADVLLDEVHHYLGVGLALELMPARAELGAQLLVVLDDAIDDDRDLARAIVVRVRILVTRPAVRGPARVAEAHDGLGRVGPGRREQGVEVADRTYRLEAVGLHEDDAGRVVAAVLEASEAVEDDGLPGASPDVAYDAAHACSLLWMRAQMSRLRAARSGRFVPPSPTGFDDSITTVPGREASAERIR